MSQPIPSEFPERLRNLLEDVPVPSGKVFYIVYDREGHILYDLHYMEQYFSITTGVHSLAGYKLSDLLKPNNDKKTTVDELMVQLKSVNGKDRFTALLLPFLNKPWNSKSDVHHFVKGIPAMISVTSFGDYLLAALHVQDYFMDKHKGNQSEDMMVVLDDNDEFLFTCHAFATNMKMSPETPRRFMHELTPPDNWNRLLHRETNARKYLSTVTIRPSTGWTNDCDLSGHPSEKWLVEQNSAWEFMGNGFRSNTVGYNGFITCLDSFDHSKSDLLITFHSKLTDLPMTLNAIGVVFHVNIFHALESSDQGAYNISIRKAPMSTNPTSLSIHLKKSGKIIDKLEMPVKTFIPEKTGENETVLFGFEKIGGAFSIYINGIRIVTLFDTDPISIPQNDRIGFLASEGTIIKDIHLYSRPSEFNINKMPEGQIDLKFYTMPGRVYESRMGKIDLFKDHMFRYVYMKDVTYSRKLLEQINTNLKNLEQELNTANKIEAVLTNIPLPKSPKIEFAYSHKSSGKVGGDLFDIKTISPEKYMVLIFDVSGHGIAASLIASMAKMSFENAFKQTLSPAAIMELLNRDICIVADASMFMTAFLCVIDLGKGELTYSRAGHCPPAVFSSKRPLSPILLREGSPLIGNSPEFDYFDYKFKLEQGDRLLLYTDGMIELRNNNDDLFGKNKLFNIISSMLGNSVNATKLELLRKAYEFAENRAFEDDITFILVSIT